MAEKVVGFYESTAHRILNRLGIGSEQSFKEWQRGRGGGGVLRYCVLAEDATSCPVWAFRGSMGDDGEISVAEPSDLFQLYFHSQLLSSPKVARAGYGCQYGLDDEGRDSFIGNPCIDGCQGTGSVDGSDLPEGNVDSEYEGTVATDNLNSSGISAVGLPPGLSIDSETGDITGIPTEAGTYLVTFMAVDDSGCALTDIAEIVIGEALPDEGGGGPDPEPPIP